MAILILLHVFITLSLVGVILVQRSEGGGLGLGGGGAGNVFTARGAANLLTRVTSVLAALFMVNCLLMTVISGSHARKGSILDEPQKTVTSEPSPQPSPGAENQVPNTPGK